MTRQTTTGACETQTMAGILVKRLIECMFGDDGNKSMFDPPLSFVPISPDI